MKKVTICASPGDTALDDTRRLLQCGDDPGFERDKVAEVGGSARTNVRRKDGAP